MQGQQGKSNAKKEYQKRQRELEIQKQNNGKRER